MKKLMLLAILSIILDVKITYAQTTASIDSLANEICLMVKSTNNKSDDEISAVIRKEYIEPFISKYIEEHQDSMTFIISLRLEKSCAEYSKIAYRNSENNGGYLQLNERPEVELPIEECQHFFSMHYFSYLEPNGDTVKLEVKDGYWIDNFKDSTYSKLKVIPVSECVFDIAFIESNNLMRKNFSKKGDTYRYQILNRQDKVYEMSVEIPGQDLYYYFKLYFD